MLAKPVLGTLKYANNVFQRALGIEPARDMDTEEYYQTSFIANLANQLEVISRERTSSLASLQELISLDKLRLLSKDLWADDKTYLLAIRQLLIQKCCSVTVEADGSKILFFSKTEANMPSPVQLHMYRLHQLARSLETAISKSHSTISRYEDLITENKKHGNKTAAARYLKQKQRLQENVMTKEFELDSVSLLLEDILETESSSEVVRIVESGTRELKKLKNSLGMPVKALDEAFMKFSKGLKQRQAVGQPSVNLSDLFPEDYATEKEAEAGSDRQSNKRKVSEASSDFDPSDKNRGMQGFGFSAGLPSATKNAGFK